MPKAISRSDVVQVTIAAAAAAYTALDQVGIPVEVTGAFSGSERQRAVLYSLSVIDKSNTKGAVNVHFFATQPTMVGVDQDALDITDANIASAKWLGTVAIAAADWTSFAANNAVATKSAGFVVEPGANLSSIWAVVQQVDAKTLVLNNYVLNVGLLQD